MSGIKVELPGIEGGNVISLEVARKRWFEDECRHLNIIVDRTLTKLTCKDCKADVVPTEWIASMIEEWYRIGDLITRYKDMKARFEAKQRCRCEHCNKITSVRPATAAEVRKFERDAKQDAGPQL